MKQYIDKAAVVAEIERKIEAHKETLKNCDSSISEMVLKGSMSAYQNLLHFLDTIETKEVDLEKELKLLDNTLFDLDGVAVQGATHYLTVEDVKDIAKHFYELGLRAKDVNEIIKTAEDHAYFAGSENTREKLIDKACEWIRDNYLPYYDAEIELFEIEQMLEDFRKAMNNETE